jgi:hypothetical protein
MIFTEELKKEIRQLNKVCKEAEQNIKQIKEEALVGIQLWYLRNWYEKHSRQRANHKNI